MEVRRLTAEAVARLASLAAIGRKSGATVVGLSAVRRTRDLALVLVDEAVSANTMQELASLQHRGIRVFSAASLLPLTRAFGREGVLVVGVRQGALAQGLSQRLAAGGTLAE